MARREAKDVERVNTLRRSLGRMATRRDMKLELSGDGATVLVRLCDLPDGPAEARPEPRPAPSNGRRRGRRGGETPPGLTEDTVGD